MCVSFASDSSDAIKFKVIIIKLRMMTASDMRLHRMFIILTLSFIQGHTDLNRENNECSIISETVQAMDIKFAVKIVQLNIICSQSDDLALHSRSQLRLKVDKCLIVFLIMHNWGSIITKK